MFKYDENDVIDFYKQVDVKESDYITGKKISIVKFRQLYIKTLLQHCEKEELKDVIALEIDVWWKTLNKHLDKKFISDCPCGNGGWVLIGGLDD